MKQETLTNIIYLLMGVALALMGVLVANTVDYHAKCDAVVVQDFSGDRYCVDKATLVESTTTNYNK
jgi:hypothetical protein